MVLLEDLPICSLVSVLSDHGANWVLVCALLALIGTRQFLDESGSVESALWFGGEHEDEGEEGQAGCQGDR